MQFKKFSLGSVVATPGALEVLTPERIFEILGRHCRGDWGIVGVEDWNANNSATHIGSRVFSAYWIDEQNLKKGKIWIITESECGGARSSTCILLPEEY